MQGKNILLTGVTGYLGSHTTIELLNRGYNVIGTLRNKKKKHHITEVISNYSDKTENLSFYQIDLLDSVDDWKKAMKGIDGIFHIASPFPTSLPKNENDLIAPAKKGTLNILQSATELGIPKVVMTSSSGAVVYGNKKNGAFSEKDWTNVENRTDTTPYFRSKTIAEKEAWNFVKNTPNAPALVTILPGAILGPIIDKNDFGTSANLVKKMMDGSMPAMPKIGFEMVDVRSVADAHIIALENQKANGNRYLCANGYLAFKDIADILRNEYPKKKIPSKELPDFLVKLFSLFDKETKPILNDLNSKRLLETTKITIDLGWEPLPLKQAVKDTAKSLIDLNFFK
ncbi:aldehyde reductase [Flammeovirgaceae bacterium SG7u.111]|nr:aldehyde reductase [Flammeovirgaceae bacterium SG7u.132]WPO37799.1 aldehyde reductase [Flammeovirgaceae bacterium SG7u.111]